jgi:hypothetical protein
MKAQLIMMFSLLVVLKFLYSHPISSDNFIGPFPIFTENSSNTTSLINLVDSCKLSWTTYSLGDTSVLLKYQICKTDLTILAKQHKCFRNGWILCNFLTQADVIIYKNGYAKLTNITYSSDFSVKDSSLILEWKLKKGKIIFNSTNPILPISNKEISLWVSKIKR